MGSGGSGGCGAMGFWSLPEMRSGGRRAEGAVVSGPRV